MLEIKKLRRQLTHNNLENFQKPTTSNLKILRQLLLAAYCDHVAKKIPDGYTSDHQRIRHAFECMETKELVYISPDSVLKGEHPEYIVYKELYQGDKKIYMREVAVIEPEWLPYYCSKLCNFSETSPAFPPRYDKSLDQVICKRATTYGPHNWQLGPVDVPMHLVDTSADLFKYFASFLLAGDVFDWFKKYNSKLLSPPSIMTKPWSKLQPRTGKLLQALLSHNIKSKKDLIQIWKKNDLFLKHEYLAWLPESVHHEINQDWKQLVSCSNLPSSEQNKLSIKP